MELFLNKEPNVVSASQLQSELTGSFGDGLTSSRIQEGEGGIAKFKREHLWLAVTRERFLDMIDALGEYDFPHFHVTSGNDDGEAIRLNYHFSLFRRTGFGKELAVTVTVNVPKSDLTIPSLYSRIPGVEYSEREILEMLGVDPVGLPNKAPILLPDDWDQSVKPWRRDETGPEGKGLINDLS